MKARVYIVPGEGEPTRGSWELLGVGSTQLSPANTLQLDVSSGFGAAGVGFGASDYQPVSLIC